MALVIPIPTLSLLIFPKQIRALYALRFPVTKYHMLVIPFRHVRDFFSLIDEEKTALMELINENKAVIESNLTPDGYNIGTNINTVAGQSVINTR